MDQDEIQYLLTLDTPELVDMIADLTDEAHHHTVIADPALRSAYGHFSPAELARRLAICERVRLHWRILAVGAALGFYNVESLKMACFRELLGAVPSEADLRPQMNALVEKMEERDNLEEDLGPLRAILLDTR